MLFATTQQLIVDLSNLVYRLYHVHHEAFDAEFVRWVAKTRKRYPGYRQIYAVEGNGADRRRRLYPEYKANREHPQEAAESVARALTLLKSVNCTIIKAPDGEADDAIASWCHAVQQPRDVVIVSRDRDLWQLVGNGVTIQSGQAQDPKVVDRYVCRNVLGVGPEGVALLKAMTGDKSDNIPRAVQRVKHEEILRAAACGTPDALTTANVDPKITSSMESIVLHYRLVLLRTNLRIVETRGTAAPENLWAAVKPSVTKPDCCLAAGGQP